MKNIMFSEKKTADEYQLIDDNKNEMLQPCRDTTNNNRTRIPLMFKNTVGCKSDKTVPYLDSAPTLRRPAVHRIFRREKDEIKSDSLFGNREKIGIMGLSACSGATFLALSLARYMASLKRGLPAFVEISSGDESANGWNYDRIGIDKRFADREFISHYKCVALGKNIGKLVNLDEGINWVLRTPLEWQISLDVQQITSLINNVAGDTVICDFSSRLRLGSEKNLSYSDSFKRLLREMSVLFLIINPAPSKLIGGAEMLSTVKGLEAEGVKVLYVLNMFGKGINRRELFDYLRPKEHITVPVLSTVELLEAEYSCKNPFQMAGVREIMSGVIDTALRRFYSYTRFNAGRVDR